ncbi:MAG TPA: DinB family protein [Saprospiraceae bacterium]|nr:DinB family protein [Saprospiraceae bacterium]
MLTFLHFFLRDLDKFIAEIEAFPSDESLWLTGGDVKNPAGTLGLHIAGNLQHFIGAILGGTGYVRNRDREFSARGVAKQEILAELKTARSVVAEVLGKMDDAQLNEVFPADHFGENRSTLHALSHLLSHQSYHLGQVNYLRRLVVSNA